MGESFKALALAHPALALPPGIESKEPAAL